MGRALLLMIAIVLLVYAVYDLLATPKQNVQYLPKWAWLALIVFFAYIGPLLWLFFGTARERPAGRRRPGPPPPMGPDDDPDFLRGL